MKTAEPTVALDEQFVIKFDRPAYSVAEWAKVIGRGETMVRKHMAAGKLIAQYPDSVAIITLEEGLRWLRSLPAEDPTAVA